MTASWEIREGDALERLADMPDESVQCCVTSPPYFGLRDYASKPSAWPPVEYALPGGTVAVAAMDCALGLEPTPEAFVGHLVLVFREVRRALRSDGTLWLNIGDSYCAAASGPSNPDRGAGWHGVFKAGTVERRDVSRQGADRRVLPNLKQKDLIGIPWLLAFALRADGWYLRRDVIWGKPNPMPESVTDRPTSAHEYVFLLAKSARYFYDADPIREEGTGRTTSGILGDRDGNHQPNGRSAFATAIPWENPAGGRNKRDVWTVPEELWGQFLRWLDEQQTELPDVWRIATQAFPGSHFATFPPKLIEPCILAGSSPKACGVCGAPWERVVERTPMANPDGSCGCGVTHGNTRLKVTDGSHMRNDYGDGRERLYCKSSTTVGWQPSCDHDDDTGRSVILDPFAGAGTTGLVALRHDRSFIGIELNSSYAEMARERIRQDAPLLNTPAEAVA